MAKSQNFAIPAALWRNYSGLWRKTHNIGELKNRHVYLPQRHHGGYLMTLVEEFMIGKINSFQEYCCGGYLDLKIKIAMLCCCLLLPLSIYWNEHFWLKEDARNILFSDLLPFILSNFQFQNYGYLTVIMSRIRKGMSYLNLTGQFMFD